jgi:hypothetical protein
METDARRSHEGARSFALLHLLRSLLIPLVIALPPLFWVVSATQRASRTPLGRDQGIFQYVAWALAQGQVDYRDVREVNGPLTHLVHRLFLALGGADDHTFRVLDLAVTGASFAFAGACLPGLGSRRAARRGPDWLERVGWAFAAWVILSGQYLLFGYWDLAQRESFFDWFMLPSVALQLVVQARKTTTRNTTPPSEARRQARWLGVVGALSVVPWFGKPTFALFTLAQLVAVVADDGLVVSRRRAVRAFLAGGLLSATLALALLFAYGDIGAFVRIQFVDVPAFYRFLWPRSTADIFSNPWSATQAIFALAGAVVLLSLVLLGEMPRRVVGLALVPLCGLGCVIAQAKGFPYHFHPVTAAVHLQWLAFAAWLTERCRVASRRWAIVRLAPVAAGVILALRVAAAMEDSPHVRATWMLWGARTPDQRATRAYFARFPEPDFFPFEMRQAAAYVREHTKADDRVQAYGMDPYILFLAERLSATPYIYAYDLDADAALAGGTGGVPSDAQAARIARMRDAHESDLLARLEARPPAAFVFLDNSPLISEPDAWDDFESHCRRAAPWVRANYRETARFAHDHVWLRTDIAPAEPSQARPDEPDSPDDP